MSERSRTCNISRCQMGYKDLQVLLLFFLGICALGNQGAALTPQEIGKADPPPAALSPTGSPPAVPYPVADSSPTAPPSLPPPVVALVGPPLNSSTEFRVTFQNWTVNTRDNNSVDQRILMSMNKNFSFSLMILNRSSCVAVVRHVPSNVPIWVANFNNSTQNVGVTDCFLNFTQHGLVLFSNVSPIVPLWSSNGTADKSINATYLELDDRGRLFLRDKDSNTSKWESFDYPTNILVTGQRLKVNSSLSAAPFNEDYWSGGLFFMQVDADRVFLYEHFESRGFSQSIPYYYVKEVPKGIEYVELQQGGLFVVLNDSTNSSVPNSVPAPGSDWQYANLEPSGGLTIFSYFDGRRIGNRTINNSGNCSLPGQCGSYGICSGENSCTCPVQFQEFNETSPGCERKETLTSERCAEDTFVSVLGNTYIGFLNNSSGNGDAEACKNACARDCTCEAALHVRENLTSPGTCYLNLGNSMQTIRLDGTSDLQTLFLRIRTSKKTSRKTAALAFAGVAGALALLLIAFSALFLYYKRRWLFEDAENGMYDSAAAEFLLPKSLLQFTYQQIVESTDNFAQKLGSGSVSCVYLGHLPNNIKIAVKKLDDNEQKEKEFLNAVTTVSSISHVNLVPLKGFCKEDQHRFLVYELVNDGRALNWYLFPIKNSGPLLNAQTRRSIALGTARGLAHLHRDCNSSGVLHGGVKPENIVIDGQMHPHVVDFGLVDLISPDQRLREADMRGARGYMAPEWVKSQPITEKVDVYSLGIVILELVSGRRCLQRSPRPDMCFLPSWGFSLLRQSGAYPDAVLELVDPLLDVRHLPASDQEVLKGMIYVALWCVQADAFMRPPMKEVVRILEGGALVDRPPCSPALEAFAREMCEAYSGERAPESSSNPFMHSNSVKRNSDMWPR